jgi:hypothetical protein
MTSNQVVTEVTQFLIQINGEVVLGLVAVSVLLSLTLLLSFKKVGKLGKKLTRLQQDLKMSHASVINIGQQLLSLEKKVNQQALSRPANVNAHTKPLLNKMAKIDSSVSRDSQIDVSQSDRSQISDAQVDNSLLDNGGSIYDKARYYLAKGDDVDSIAQRCNLSHAEVSLLKALSKKPAETFSR